MLRREAKASGLLYEAHSGGLNEAAKAAFVKRAGRFSGPAWVRQPERISPVQNQNRIEYIQPMRYNGPIAHKNNSICGGRVGSCGVHLVLPIRRRAKGIT